MVSCIAIETASLVFASISLLSTCMGSFLCVAVMVYMNVLLAYLVSTTSPKAENFNTFETGIAYYGLYINIGVAVSLSFTLIALSFTIILIKGLLSKKGHLVKAYFVYGVSMNSLSAIGSLIALLTRATLIGLLGLLGCFFYSFILIIINSTYHKLSNPESDQFGHKKLETEKQYV